MKKPNKTIYLDNASSAPIDASVLKSMQNSARTEYQNPSGLHKGGLKAKKALNEARKSVAGILGGHPDEIIFTGSGTEGNNLAIRGAVSAAGIKKPHIVTTNIEHASVLETCRALEKEGIEVTYVPVEENGIVDPQKIRAGLKKNTVLVSVMYANNEIGTIQPIQEIAKAIRHFKKSAPQGRTLRDSKVRPFSADYPLFHTDAVQAMNYLPIKVEKLGVDLLTLNGSKIYGPKGTGVLWKKRNAKLNPIMFGGSQEGGLRPGTENVPAIIGFAKALEITEKIKEKESKRLTKLRDYFIDQFTSPSPLLTKERAKGEVIINGDLINRLPNNVNISVPGIESELLVIELDAYGIEVSSKSACKQDDPDESYVLAAIRGRSSGDSEVRPLGEGLARRSMAEGSIRFSLGRSTTKSDISYALKALKTILAKLKIWYN